jgi:hypothetical protein
MSAIYTLPANKNRVAVAFRSNTTHSSQPIIRPFHKSNLWARGLHDTSATTNTPPPTPYQPENTQTHQTKGDANMNTKTLQQRQADLLRTIPITLNLVSLIINDLQKISSCATEIDTVAKAMAQHLTNPGCLKSCLR